MRACRIVQALWMIVLHCVVAQAWAAPITVGASSLDIPEPLGFVAVTPQMRQVWTLVQAGQGDNRILAFYIPSAQGRAALAGQDADLSRNINVQVLRRFEARDLTPADFQRVIQQIEALVAARQVDAIQAKVLEKYSGNLQQATGANLSLAQTKNLTLPAHIKQPGHFAYSEISTIELTLPGGRTQEGEVTATAAAVLIKGKLLMCYVTGAQGDLQWTRATAQQWVDALLAANPS